MKLYILGTGNGGAVDCYNTCFAVENNEEYLLVDGGGGNTILKQLKLANIDITQIHNVFLSHNHTDHILGVIWIVRDVCHKLIANKYQGCLNVYGSDESMRVLKSLVETLFPLVKKFEDRIVYNIVEDKQQININNINFTFFDIHAKKEKQFGFAIDDELIFCGDEPLKEDLFEFAKDKKWLIHESFCLDSDEISDKAHLTGHCTVKEASITAQKINAKNLIILHTEDNDLKNRKKLYTNEAKLYFDGSVYVPDDLEIIEI